MSERAAFLAWVQARLGTPYCWPHASNGFTGKGLRNPANPDALDCSGTVTCGLYNATSKRIDWRATHNAHRLFTLLEATTDPKPGDLVFYGRRGYSSHVMVWVGDGRVIGASGGNSDTLTREVAQRQGACVKYRKSVDYRPDRLAYRALPLP